MGLTPDDCVSVDSAIFPLTLYKHGLKYEVRDSAEHLVLFDGMSLSKNELDYLMKAMTLYDRSLILNGSK